MHQTRLRIIEHLLQLGNSAGTCRTKRGGQHHGDREDCGGQVHLKCELVGSQHGAICMLTIETNQTKILGRGMVLVP